MYTQNILLIPGHKNIDMYRCTLSENYFYWFVSYEILQSSATSAPCLIRSKTNWANSQPANPPVWQKKANLCIGNMERKE